MGFFMKKFVVLDTETTGLGSDAEIIEIAIVDHRGRVLLDTKVKCQEKIPVSATRIHGITEQDLVNAPSWSEIHDDVMAIISDAENIVIYNANFDLNMLFFTAQRNGFCIKDALDDIESKTTCAMLRYAEIYNNSRWAKLVDAADDLGICTRGMKLHSALGDCELTRFIWLEMIMEARLEAQRKKRIERQRNRRQKEREMKSKMIPSNIGDYPYFGLIRPKNHVALSKVKASEIKIYEYAGTCVNGHLLRKKAPFINQVNA